MSATPTGQIALEASEARYRRLFEAAKDGILILHAETGEILDVNPFLTVLTGYSREDFLGKPLWEIGPLRDVATSKSSYDELKANGYVRYEDLPLRTVDGRTVAVEFISNVYREADGDVIQCNIRDISERKRTEAQIAALSRFPEENPNPVLRILPDGTLLYANPSAGPVLRHWGCEPGQSLPAEGVALVADALATGSRHEVEVDCGGQIFKLIFCPLQTQGYVNVYGDEVTERRRADRELQEAKQLVDSVVENVPLMIFLKEAQDLRFVVVNRAGEELLGYDRKDLLGKNNLDLFPPEQAAFFMAKDREVLAAGVDLDIPEEPILTAKKGQRLLHTRKACIKGADGVTKYLLGISEDITERKRMETERENLEEQLRASQKMDAIGSLAGGVAHDFNNLLTVILSYVNFAIEAIKDGDPIKDDLLQVEQAGQRAAGLTRQLLAFSRRQVLQPVPLSLNEVASGVEQMLGRILGEDIDLVQGLAPDLGRTLADPGQIEQVLMNLVVNARDAMPAGGQLTIETSNVELDKEYAARYVDAIPGSYVMLAVSDTGCGMDAQTRSRVFEPFFTTKEAGRGTGLGLSMVYGIVKQSGGNIHVYSEPGAGTTVKVYLPRMLTGTTTATRVPAVHPRSTGTETILVVEDEEALRNVAVRILEAAGYTVLTAEGGAEALVAAAQRADEIHLLLTDVVMPKMSGRALAQELLKTRPALRVLYMSGYTDDAIVHHGVLDPGTHFCGKPFTAEALTRKVREALD